MENLSAQDQEFVKEVAITGNQTQAAKKAYGIDSDKYAGKKGSLLVAKGSISTAIEEVKRTIAEQIPDDLLVRVHLEGLNASRTIKGSDGQEIVEPDYAVRHKYLDTGHKLKGTYAPDKSISLNMNADIANPKARELAEKYEDELKRNL